MATQSIPVLPYQVRAAKLIMLIAEKDGRTVSPKIRMLAAAGRTPQSDSPYVVNGTAAATANAAGTPLDPRPADAT